MHFCRHEKYPNQFRAMFVTNCKVIKTERYTPKNSGGESYFPVKCETCDTHVAMLDNEEVYHFFNVIPA